MDTRAPKPFVFVLMPFSDDFNDIYQLGIKAACDDSGTYCERVDEQFYHGSMLERIYNQIKSADILIADMTGQNANVFYEVGYAHALGKRVILLTQDYDDIPFDLKHHHHIVYGRQISKLKDDLTKRIKWATDTSSLKNSISEAPDLRFYIGGKPVVEGGKYSEEVDTNTNTIDLKLSIKYNGNVPYIGRYDEIGIVLPAWASEYVSAEMYEYHNDESIMISENLRMYLYREMPIFNPGSWQSITERLDVGVGPDEMDVSIRHYRSDGIHETNFVIALIRDRHFFPNDEYRDEY